MKKFLRIMILSLLLITPSQADDIKDFQVEEMSIGDSLLDYFTKEQITKGITSVYDNFEDKSFVMAGFLSSEYSFKKYDVLQISFRTQDKNYKIYGIAGKLMFYENIDDCYKMQNEILKDLSPLMKDARKVSEILTHGADPTGRSKLNSITWWLKSGDLVSLDCYDWHEDMPYADNLKVNLDTKEFNDWLVKWE